jgi:hypothetical protein
MVTRSPAEATGGFVALGVDTEMMDCADAEIPQNKHDRATAAARAADENP